MPARPLLASLALASALVLGASACSDGGSSSDGAPPVEEGRSTSTAADDTTDPTGAEDPAMPGDGTTSTTGGGGEPTAPAPTAPGTGPTTPTTVVDGVAVPVITRAALAAELADRLAAQVGRPPTGLTCGADLVGITGRTATCELVDGTERYPVTARVSSVRGLDVSFDYEVAAEPAA